MEYVLCILVGLLIGYFIGSRSKKGDYATGRFVVNSTDPEKDIFLLDLDNVDDIYVKDKIVLDIKRDFNTRN